MIDSPQAPSRTAEQVDRAASGLPGSAKVWALVAGVCLAASVPPWGWWPLSFVGIAIIDRLLIDTTPRQRFGRMWLAAAAWLYPAMLWMWDLTAPGYVAAGAFYAAYFGLAGVVTVPRLRRWLLPGTFALAEFARWSWPFGGVPLAHLGLSQAESPLRYPARLAGPLLVVMAVVVVGQALSATATAVAADTAVAAETRQWRRQWRPPAVALGLVALAVFGAFIHPRSDVVRTAEVALVQGGGPQQTRASSSQEPVVLARHIEGSARIEGPVDLVIWPENVVNPGRYLDLDNAYDLVVGVARELNAPVVAGWFRPVSDTVSANYQSIINPDGTETDVYNKVQIVPFGEYVPLRDLITRLAPDAGLPRRDLRVGTEPPVLDTPVGPIGVSISWEGFFEHRSRHSVREGAQLLTNPTNGSSYWLTQVQTQQVASNQLRAVENDRWVVQVAPTGMSAVISPDGELLTRTDVSERATITATVEMRDGRTLASIVGPWPVVIYGLGCVAVGCVALGRPQGLRRRGPG